jgi:signal-transduction protein with cAMP-binding, CBS, and nucleotidyltransferase domain
MLMNVALFTCLDNDEMYKLILMVKELPPFKADQIIIEKDEPVSRLYLVMKG